MITLQLIHEVINTLRDRAQDYHVFACEDAKWESSLPCAVDWRYVSVPKDSGPCVIADVFAPKRAEAARLAMAWHDVCRGCHDEFDLQMRIAETAETACVEMFRAEREAARGE